MVTDYKTEVDDIAHIQLVRVIGMITNTSRHKNVLKFNDNGSFVTSTLGSGRVYN